VALGESAAFAIETGPLEAGKHTLHLRLSLAGDDAAANDHDSLHVRVGPGPLEITEIQFHPASGEGEWVEVRNRGATPVDPARFTLSDRGTQRGVPSGGSGAVPVDSLAVLAQDRAALLARYAWLDPDRVWQASPWSALNNSNDSSGVADVVVLRESDGTRCDRVDYSASGVPAGVPVELRDGAWQPSLLAGGTPLGPPATLAALAGRFEIAPRRLRAGGTARLSWSLPWSRARVTIEVFDLAGRRVTRVVPELFSTSRGDLEWPLADLGPGLFLVALLARAESGGESLTETRALRVEGAAP
jgi:hypothetical protein